MKSYDYLYKKILKDVKRYASKLSDSEDTHKFYYVDDNGTKTEAVFDFKPTKDELEGLLIFLNKDSIANA